MRLPEIPCIINPLAMRQGKLHNSVKQVHYIQYNVCFSAFLSMVDDIYVHVPSLPSLWFHSLVT